MSRHYEIQSGFDLESVQYDDVECPEHYCFSGIECIDAIQSQLTEEEYSGFLKGQIIKYVWRERLKGGVKSLRKAHWYLERLIELNEQRTED